MAVDLHTLTTCNADHECGDANRIEPEPPTTTVSSGDGAEAEAVVYKKGAWSKEEDEKLKRAVDEYGLRNWVTIEKLSGLARPAKNCRLRWLNYLRPNLKKYPFTKEEEKIILHLHSKYGNSWSRIASKLPGRSDNEIKNFWHKRAKKCQKQHLPIYPTRKEKKQIHTNDNNYIDEANADDDEHFPNYYDDDVPTNYPPSTSTHSPEFQPCTLNVVKTASHSTDASTTPSIHSPQTLISTPQPQFLSSPSSPTTSHKHSPTDHLTDQTTILPNTPTSQTQNLLLSPHQGSQTTETPLLIHDTAPRIQAPSLWQGGASSNAFTPLRKPPILSSPQGRWRRFSRATSQLSQRGHSISGSANSVSAFLPPDSSLKMQWSSAVESPRSPLKLKLSPGTPALYSVQMSTQTTDSPVASLSGFHLKSPTIAPLSPLKLRLSIPVASESCFQSNLSIPDSTVRLNSSTPAVPLSSPLLKPSSCSLDLPSIQPMTVDTDHVIPMDSSLTVKTKPSSIQFYPPATPGTNTGVHEVESDSSLEIMNELREAQAKVRFLKKKLGLRRISNKRSLLKESSSKEPFFSESPETTELLRTEVPQDRNSIQSTTESLLHTSSRTKNFLGDILRVNAPPKNSRKKDMLKRMVRKKADMIGISKTGALQVKSARKENRLSKVQKIENTKSGKYTQRSIESEKVTQGENSETKTLSEESLRRKEDSLGEIFNRKNSMTFQEQRHSIDLFDHLNSQNTVNAPNSDSWYNKLSPIQGPAGKCLNECSTIEGLFSESSTLLQDSFLQGDLFGQRSGIEDPLSSQTNVPLLDAFGPVYSQSTTTTPVNPGDEGDRLSYLQPDEGGYFGYSFGREFSDGLERKFTEDGLMDGNLTAKSILCESNLLLKQYPAADLLDSSYLVSKPIMEHESLGGKQLSLQISGRGNSADSQLCESSSLLHQYPAANLLHSSYLVSKQIMEQESSGGKQFSLQTSGGGKLAETSKLCESTLLLHQSPAANLIGSRYLVGFEHECRRDEQYSLQTSTDGFDGGGMKTECTSRETWKQDPSGEQSMMEGLLVENLWPEGQMVSQEQTFSANRFDSVVELMESKNWNDESGCGHTGEVLKQEQEHDHMNTMPEELSSLLEFFPTTIQTLEWYNIGDAIPDTEASDEFDMGLGLHMSSTSQPLITIADYI
ncbi:hypothetical protein Pfo_022922 [Paulownia fortunei]|nr:hypothetical protein Pfo_022922 [Paulownia fortunei]